MSVRATAETAGKALQQTPAGGVETGEHVVRLYENESYEEDSGESRDSAPVPVLRDSDAADVGEEAFDRLELREETRRRRLAEAEASRLAARDRATRCFSEASTRLSLLAATIAEQIAVESGGSCAAVLFGDGDVPGTRAIYPAWPATADIAEALAARAPLPDVDGPHHVFPLVAHGSEIGALCVSRPQAFSADERAFVVELAERAALVAERALLYEATRRARGRAELLYALARLVIGAENTEDALEPSLDAIAHAVEANRAAVLLYDADGVMRFRAWRDLSERYRAAVEGHSPWSRDARSPEPVIVPDARCSPALAPLLPAIEAEGIRALAFVPLVAEGRIIGKFMLYFDEPHQLSPSDLEVAVTIANHVAAAVARLEAVAELRETVRFNEMFTALLGHDLRNPLGAIMTAAQLAMKRVDDERLHKPLGRIVSGGQRMARMIDQLLDFTRVRVGGGLPLSAPQRFDMLALLRNVVDSLDKASAPPIALDCRGDSTGEWDAERLEQVFSTLVGNAVRHGAPGRPVRVRVDGSDPTAVRVDVVNDGSIPPDLAAKLFEPMTGGDGTRQKSHGLGLGLFIAKQIVRAHGGTIDVHPEGGAEIAFQVVLPRVAQRAPGTHR
jgi:signal transduction histidine kinase